MVAVDEVGVQLDAACVGSLDRGVGLLADFCRARDVSEVRACGKGDERGCFGSKRLAFAD